MTRPFNFSAGPAVLPVEVLEEAQQNLLSYPGVGMSILEISHRSKTFDEIIQGCEADMRALANIPSNYTVLFLQGGASLQFSMVPMNLLPAGGSADYLVTGVWAEKAVKEAAQREFPDSEYSIYIHGHSTGGPFAMMASQRVPNIAGLVGYGSSPFGWMYPLISGDDWEFSFNQLRLRTWRDTARYMYEGMKHTGAGLPMLIELTFERWERAKKRPNFKAEDFIHKNSTNALKAAASAAAARLKLSHQQTEALIQRYLGYTRELSGPGVKPVPNFLSIHGIDDDTVTFKRCERSLPLFAKLNPAPKVRSISLGAGIHSWGWTDEEFPMGIVPPVAKLWHDAIINGFFVQ